MSPMYALWMAVHAVLLGTAVDAAPTVRKLLETASEAAADLPQPMEQVLNRQVSGLNLIDGDILLQEGQRSLISSEVKRWCGAIVPYTLSSQYTAAQKADFTAAFNDFASLGITFKERSGEQNYLDIRYQERACYSYIGNIGSGGQVVNLHPDCFSGAANAGVIHHELMHALGFYHEQSRPDRDQYVTILFENIVAGKESNFRIEGSSLTQGTAYDYASVMHYGATDFGKNGLVTIQTPNGETIGNRLGFSTIDQQELLLTYSLEAQQRWADICGGVGGSSPSSSSSSF